jgi:hypothetical protein
MITVFLAIAAIPFIYYLIAIYSSWRYFRQSARVPDVSFTPPVSILKPIRGLDPDASENLASFCRLDYPEYEIVFCVDPDDEAVLSVLSKLTADYPQCRIIVLYGSGRVAANDKVAKLARLVNEAAHEVVVISDSDVRVRPDYLRQLTAPLRDPKVGAVTCFYLPTELATFTDHLQSVGMMSDFYAGILVAWQLDGVKFALGPTIATTRARLNGFGGYPELENRRARLRSGAAQLRHRDRLRLRIAQRSAAQAPALDRCDAPYAPVGTLGIVADPGIALVARSGRGSSLGGGRTWLFGRLSGAADRDDVDHRHSRPARAGIVETDAAHSSLGRRGVRHLAHEFRPQQHSVARRRLLHPGWATRSGRFAAFRRLSKVAEQLELM